MGDITELQQLIKSAQANPIPDAIAKAFTQSGSPTTGLTAYDLEQGAKVLYPVLTPLRNSIPRVKGDGGTATNWKAITGINTNRLAGGVSQGNRGGVIATTTKDYTAPYRGIGFEDYATFEADYAAGGFEDVKARAAEGLLRSLMIYEESLILGGNSSLSLGTTPTPTVANTTTGGNIAAGTYNVICVALTLEGFQNVGSVGQVITAAPQVQGSISRVNADGSSDTYGGGSAQKSAAGSTTTTGSTSTITASVAAVSGAFAYAWFAGTAGSERLQYISTINSVSLTSLNGVGQLASALPSSDNSVNNLVFDGLLTQCLTAGSGATIVTQATGAAGTGTPLTSDGAGGIVEIDTIFRSMWENYRLSPDIMYVNSQELFNITKKVIAGGAAPLFRFNIDKNSGGVDSISAGAVVGSYLNKYTMGGGQLVKVVLHPNVPAGTILFRTTASPYPLSGVDQILRIKTRKEYYQLEWPLRSRKYEYGVYADELLQNYFPPAFAVLNNIGNG